MRKRDRTPAIREEFKRLIMQHCTFVNDWNDPILKPDIMPLFAKKRAKMEAEECLLRDMKRKYGDEMIYSSAMDFESSIEGNWMNASHTTTKLLSKNIKEPETLCFSPMQLTESPSTMTPTIHSHNWLYWLRCLPQTKHGI